MAVTVTPTGLLRRPRLSSVDRMGTWASGIRAGALALVAAALALTAVAHPPLARAAGPSDSGRLLDTRTQVTFSPVVSANRLVFDDITVLDATGQPLSSDLYERIASTGDAGTGYASGPVLMVDPSVEFTIGLNGQSVHANQPFTVTVVRRGETRSISIEDLNPSLTGQVAIEPIGALIFRGVPLQRAKVTQTFETATSSYRFVGIESAATADSSLSMRTFGNAKRVIFRDTNDTRSLWSLQMRSTTKTSTSRFHATGVRVPRGDQLIVVYPLWRGSLGRPTLWLDQHSDGRLDTRLTLTRG